MCTADVVVLCTIVRSRKVRNVFKNNIFLHLSFIFIKLVSCNIIVFVNKKIKNIEDDF